MPMASSSGDRCSARTMCTRRWLRVFDLPAEKVRVIQAETAAHLAARRIYPSLIAAHAGLLALKAGRLSRSSTTARKIWRRPPSVIHRAPVTARQWIKTDTFWPWIFRWDLDGGAYATVSPTVLSRATIHSAGPYLCENIRVRSHAWATNVPPHGAFRGFGSPQTIFGIERHMDQIAKAVGISPEEVRRRKFSRSGQRDGYRPVDP